MRSLLVLILVLLAPVSRADEDTLRLAALPSDAELLRLIWVHHPDSRLAAGRIGAAEAEVSRSHLLPNPSLDLSWNTIPVGPTNPTDLASPLANVPNYAVSVSVPIEIGKRGPRQDATRALARVEALQDTSQLRDRFFGLLDAIAEIAADETRLEVLRSLAADAARLSELERLRAGKGDIATLDSDRALLEEQKLQSALGEQEEKFGADQRTCSELAGLRCEPFGSTVAAGKFLARQPDPSSRLDERPDLQALQAQVTAATANRQLAVAHWIPDPTVRVGYVRDQFVVSGNQQNSLFVGVNFPLPVFDHGQADAASAEAQSAASREARQSLLQLGQVSLTRVEEQLSAIEKRRSFLRDKTLPLARTVTTRLEAAVQRGAAPLQDLLISRRSEGDLLVGAADLDLAAFHLAISRARIAGATPPIPQPLTGP